MSSVDDHIEAPFSQMSALERQVVDVFVDGVRVLGLPRSVGEIYGLLFVSRQPLALDDLVSRLGISKGSASQGLRTLKGLGAVHEEQVDGMRRMHYVAATDLKRLAGGFIKEQVRPHLESGQSKVGALHEAVGHEEDLEKQEFYAERIEKLESWMRKGRRILPMLQKLLGQ